MKEFIENIDNWTLAKVITLWTLLLSSLISFIAYFIKDYFINRWKSRQEKEIEYLRTQASQNNLLLGNITNSINNLYLSSNTKRMECIEATWQAMVELKKQTPTLIYLAHTILSKEEIIDLPNSRNEFIQANIARFDPDVFLDSFRINFLEVQKYRPFIGENLWLIYVVYQAYIGRLTVLFREGIKKGIITYWKDDTLFIEQVLYSIIKPSEFKILTQNDASAFNNVINYLESKALDEISEQITGKRMTEESLNHALKLSNLSRNTGA